MNEWNDSPLPEDDAIAAAHPMESGRHDLYAEAMRLVGARRSKGALVDLVTWLLSRIPASPPAPSPGEAEVVWADVEMFLRIVSQHDERIEGEQATAVLRGDITKARELHPALVRALSRRGAGERP